LRVPAAFNCKRFIHSLRSLCLIPDNCQAALRNKPVTIERPFPVQGRDSPLDRAALSATNSAGSMRPFKAIAAMSENRVIGCGGKIPWHLPEDFRFFRQMTVGNILVMGRKTFQMVGRPLPDRHTIVLSR
jgi:hypothetical protein